MLTNCFTCNQSISEKARFCSKCTTPVRCKVCGEDLVEGGVICEVCGADVVQRQSTSAIPMNQFEYRDGKKDIAIKAAFTNEVGESAATIFAMIRGGQAPIRSIGRSPKVGSGQEELFTPAEIVGDENSLQSLPPAVEQVVNKNEPATQLQSLFEQRDGDWIFINPNIKAKNKSDFFKKATCLYLQMQSEIGIKTVSKDEIKKFLDIYDAYDGNVRKWFTKEKTLLRVTTNDLSIIYPGSQLAAETLLEISDDSVQSSWKVGTVRKVGRKQSTKKQSALPDDEQSE